MLRRLIKTVPQRMSATLKANSVQPNMKVFFCFLFAEAYPSSPSRACFTVDFWIVVSSSFKEGEED